jgi:hypothetical protein
VSVLGKLAREFPSLRDALARQHISTMTDTVFQDESLLTNTFLGMKKKNPLLSTLLHSKGSHLTM